LRCRGERRRYSSRRLRVVAPRTSPWTFIEQPTGRRKRLNVVRLLSARQTVRTLHLPFGRTALCLDCETCFEIGTDRCPVCGSGAWASVARFLHGRLTDARHPRARSATFER